MAPLSRVLPKFVCFRFGRPFIRRADSHRDRAEWIEAVLAYRRALEWMPWREDLQVQIGNCLKEFGDVRGAAAAYRAVGPGANRTEAVRQLADANRRAGLFTLPYAIAEDAEAAGVVAMSQAPLPPLTPRLFPNRLRIDTLDPRGWLGVLGHEPRRAARKGPAESPAILLDQVGTLSLTRDGLSEPLLAGVIAIRARIFSTDALDVVEFWLGQGEPVRIATAAAVPVTREGAAVRLHVVNAWIDSGRLPAGRHWLAIRTADHALATGLFVNVADHDQALELAGSSAFVPSPAADESDVAAAVTAAPAAARAAIRSPFDGPIRAILAMRVDHLGDVAASLPALARLRALFPDAALTVLVQPPVRAIVAASGLADHVLTVELTYDALAETHYLPPDEERRIAALLGQAGFDLAIDLCSAPRTRPLLLLSGATWLVGFNPHVFAFLDYGLDVRSRDKANQLETVSHAAAVLTLVEGLAVATAGARRPVARVAASALALADHGLVAGRYVVLHAGARYAINRWPIGHFIDLAGRLIAQTDLPVVLFSDGPATLPSALAGGGRIRLLGHVDPDDFDAILANARLFVGNDSGPKHLAAVRGVPTISLHVDRLNWNEWGQDGGGTILAKRVPCAGCGLNDIDLCGRAAVCVRAIRVDEVMAAARPYL